MKIIIVEDEDVIRDGLAKLVCKIKKDSEVIATAKNGKEGLEIIFQLKPDLVITDINMPHVLQEKLKRILLDLHGQLLI